MSLIELEEDVKHCTACNLHKNGKQLPYWTEHSQYILLMDVPVQGYPDYMDKFWELFREVGLSKQEFVVLHTVQCHTKMTKRMGKPHYTMPSRSHREECRPWLHAYLKELGRTKMLVMGNVPMEHMIGEFNGIKEKNATVVTPKMCGIPVPCVLSVSPSFLKNQRGGKELLKKSLVTFKNL